MRKFLILAIIAMFAVAMIGLGTFAYFSDIEESGVFAMKAGTIDIDIADSAFYNGFEVPDLKPCKPVNVTFTVRNVGENPAVVWKHVEIVNWGTGDTPESELPGDNYIADDIIYDLFVGSGEVFVEEDSITLDDISCYWMPLGTLEKGESVTIEQSYHLAADTGNEAQGDFVDLRIDIYAEQRNAPGPEQRNDKLFLDNKTGHDNWDYLVDQTWGLLSWDDSSSCEYDLQAQGLRDQGYSLIVYSEDTSKSEPWKYNTVKHIADYTPADGKINVTGENTSVTADPDNGEVIWLVPTSALNTAKNQITNWEQMADFLYEGYKVVFP